MCEGDQAEEMTVVDIPNIALVPEGDIAPSVAVKLPLDSIPLLGTAFSSLPEAFRTVTTTSTVQGPGGAPLCYLTDRAGNLLDIDQLSKFKDGSGTMGSMHTQNGFVQARLHKVSGATKTVTTTVPIDPTTMFMAAALMQINQKLDEIADMQRRMFAYAKERDRAKILGGISTIDEVRATYRFNSENELYISSRCVAVSQTKRDAVDAVALQREQLKKQLTELGLIHTGADVQKKTGEMAWALRDYQLATYLYSYATLVDVILVRNFDASYLGVVITDMARRADDYSEMYDRCIATIRRDAKRSIGARVTAGLGAAQGALGSFVASTFVGNHTQIDEALIGGSQALSALASKGAEKSMELLEFARPGCMDPFIESIRDINRMHNEPALLAVGPDAVYVLSNNKLDEGAGDSDADFEQGVGVTDPDLDAASPDTIDCEVPPELADLVDDEGRVKKLASDAKSNLCAYWYVASRADTQRSYTREELDEFIGRWLPTVSSSIARYKLVDYGLITLSADRTEYSFAQDLPALNEFVSARIWSPNRQ